MNARAGSWHAALLLTVSVPANAAEPTLPRDGWVSWQVAAVDGAPSWCCFSSWNDRDPSRMTCNLDGGRNGYGIRHGDATTDTVKVYARQSGGKLDRLQVVAAACPVETKTPIQPLGNVSEEDSIRWLVTRAKQDVPDAITGEPMGQSALAALAMHRGDAARDALAKFARDPRVETRKWSVFWSSMVRGAEGADLASSVMFNDRDAEVREHAAFALAQSKAPRVAPDLIRLGNTDQASDVRSKAWFWLAHTGAPDAERAISAALRKDGDEEVREEAIFALSQLPDERATRALIGVAEDQSLAREQRRRAVFWLAQSEAPAAQAYLERVLARNAR